MCSPDSLWAQNLIGSTSLVQLNGQVGGGAVTQTLSLTSAPNPNTAFSTSITNCTGGNWLTVTPSSGTTPQTLSFTASPGALTAATYSCTANVTSANSSIGIAVLFSVSGGGSGSFTSNPASLAFTYQLGGAPSSTSITISSPFQNVLFTASATSSPTNWLLVNNAASTSGATGTAQATITASMNPSGLVAGTYSGTIAVTGSGVPPLNIPVTLTVNANPTLIAAPTSLIFNYQLNTAVLPPAQVINLTSNGTPLTNVTATTATQSCGSGWLVVSPLSGQLTPAFLNVFVAIPANAPNVCTGSITISTPGAQNPTVQIPVTLNLSNNPVLNATPTVLTLRYQTGTTAPGGTVALSSSSTQLNFSAVASVSTPAGGNWLNVTPTGGTTPAVLNIGTTPQGLAAGTYNG
ncbi:MAG: hypothetical protein ABIZ80_11450, partial [Bryobacteraceae bacterium]